MEQVGIGLAGIAAATGAAVVLGQRLGHRRRPSGAAFVGGRASVHVHPYLRPPAMQGTLKARSVFVDDWRGRRV